MSSAAPGPAAPQDQDQPALQRRMGTAQLLAYGLVFIGPAAAVGVWGTLDAKSGGVVPVVYLVATLVMGLTASSYALMSRAVPRAGSVFAYASEGIGRRVGHMGGWMMLLDYVLIPSVAYLFSGIALHSLVPQVPVWAFVALAVVVSTGLNLAGITVTSRVIAVVVLVEVLVLAAVVIAGIGVLASHGPVRGWLDPLTGGAAGLHPSLVLGAVSVAVLSYLGFDALATFAEETRGGASAIGRATLVCLAVAGLLFVVQTYLGALLSPLTPQELQADPSLQGDAYYAMVDSAMGPLLHALLSLAKGAGAMFSALVGQAAASRIIMDMARSGSLPRALSRVSPRTGAPVAGVLIAAAGNVAVSLWASTRGDGLDVVSSAVDVGAITGFVLVHASVIGYFAVRRRGGPVRPLVHVVIPVVGALLLLAVLISSSPLALLVGGGWAVLGVLLLLVRQRRDGHRQDPAPRP
ncbi:amino acid permease [Brachybacterium endophyticum]|uniref:Amino acid permease n=2 Tax=Brachybacterium endophyticum TaxID=2182385 RepID=A0A2U2RLS6_9MICO|nr:amino acid permease [Brachybacterium endophyticum]